MRTYENYKKEIKNEIAEELVKNDQVLVYRKYRKFTGQIRYVLIHKGYIVAKKYPPNKSKVAPHDAKSSKDDLIILFSRSPKQGIIVNTSGEVKDFNEDDRTQRLL